MDIETKESILGWAGRSIAFLASFAFVFPFILIATGFVFA